MENSRKNASQRLIGTVIGALYGLLYLLMRNWSGGIGKVLDAFCISAFIVVILYTTVLIQKKQASYFSCVVFLSIVVNHVTDVNPYLFVWNRFLDTVIGIIIGVGVNLMSLPRDRRKDVLFLSGLDDTLLSKKDNMSDYSRIELNRMLDDGMNFTIVTMRTPASLMTPLRDIRLKLPVIAMDGAVLFDIYEKRYLKVYIISQDKSSQIRSLIRSEGLTCFTNVVIDDMLVIYYDKSKDEVHNNLIRELRRSPYRNYVDRPYPEDEDVVYFMLLHPTEVIEAFYKKLEDAGITKELKVLKYASDDYPGYAYIKIYNRNATKENMIQYLQKMTGLSQIVTFGTIPGRYDVVVRPGDTNKVVNQLRKLYEPVKYMH